MTDWATLDATELAALVHRGEATATELVESSIRAIEAVDGKLGAVPIRSFEAALEQARHASPELPLAGVPFLLKDVGARQVGHPYYAGNRALREADHRAETDTPLGARFREIGLITLGSSNAPEFGMQSNTWPLVHGPTRNPWDLERSAGGSSGGACAAVAAGLVPVAHASDGAGSIRIPAAWCGLIGLKPSRDRIVWRHAGQQRADVEFVVARSLRDTATLLDLLRPRRARATKATPYRESVAPDTVSEPLRIGVSVRCPGGVPVDASIVAAVRATADRLADLGHDLREQAPDGLFEFEERALIGAVLGPTEYAECLEDLGERLGRPVDSDDVEPFLWTLAQTGHAPIEPEDLERAAAWAEGWAQRIVAFFDDFDLLLTPTVPTAAPTLASLDPDLLSPLELLEAMVPHMAFTEPWNATGQPAISLPLGETETGLPVGIQLIAGPRREDRLLAVAASLLPGVDGPPQRPPIHA